MVLEAIRETAASAEVLAKDVLSSTNDPVSRNLCLDILEELEYKKQILSQDLTALESGNLKEVGSVVLFNGVLLAIHRVASYDWGISDDKFSLNKGDHFINLHIPRNPGLTPARTVVKVGLAYGIVARHITENGLDIKYMVGITYKRLADTSSRHDFKTRRLNLPENVLNKAESFYKANMPEGLKNEPIGGLVICYRSIT